MKTVLLIWVHILATSFLSSAQQYDVVVYGATGGGVIAAVAAAREGARVALVEPGRFLGGLTTGAIGQTGGVNRATIGGYGLEFYRQVGAEYDGKAVWDFEPHVAELVLQSLLKKAGVRVYFEQRLREERGVKKKKGRIQRFISEDGEVFQAAVFIDASYEGDLVARAGVTYEVGPEGPVPVEENYSYVLCLSSIASNRIAFPKPLDYDPARYDAWLARIEEIGREKEGPARLEDVALTQELPGGKVAAVAVSGGIGLGYVESTYRQRAVQRQALMNHTAGLFYFLAHDSRLPQELRNDFERHRLCADEFAYSNHWPHQLYIREGRRMVGDDPVTWQDLGQASGDAIGVGEFRGKPFAIPFRVLTPARRDASNLLGLSTPNAGMGVASALRPEPVTYVLGQAAGVASAMAASGETAVQDIDTGALAEKLGRQGAILRWP